MGIMSVNAEELSLIDAVNAALTTDERIAAAQSNFHAAEEGRVGARSYYLPRVNAVGNFGHNSIDQLNSSGSLQRDGRKIYGGIEVQQDLWTFGRNGARVRKAEAEINIAQYDLIATQHEVILDTVKAFLGTRESKEIALAYDDHVATLKELLKGTEAKSRLSLATATELALVNSRHQQALAQQSMATVELMTHRDELSRLVQRNFSSIASADRDMNLILPNSLDITINDALNNAPEYLKANYKMAAAKAKLDEISAERYPALTATGRWVKGRVGDSPTGDKEVILSMSMPLYDGGRASSKIRQAKHDLWRTRHTKNSIESRTKQKAKTAFVTLNSVRHVSSSWQSALSAEKKSLRGIEKEVEASLAGLPYLLEAKDKMMMVRIQAIKTKSRAHLAEFELLNTTGDILNAFISYE